MNRATPHHSPTVNAKLFNENSGNYPYEEWIKFAGQQIAWNLDGTRILASGVDYPQLFNALNALGIDLSQVVLDYVPTKDEESLI